MTESEKLNGTPQHIESKAEPIDDRFVLIGIGRLVLTPDMTPQDSLNLAMLVALVVTGNPLDVPKYIETWKLGKFFVPYTPPQLQAQGEAA